MTSSPYPSSFLRAPIATAWLTASLGLCGLTLAQDVTVNVGDLPPGKSVTIVFQATVDDPVAAGVDSVSNQGTVSGTNFSTASTDDPDVGGAADPTTTPVDAVPDLVLTKGDGNATGTPGGSVSYTLGVTNVGDQGATGVVISDTVPANATFDSVSSTAGWVCAPDGSAGSLCTFAVGSLAGAGASANATFAVTLGDPLPAGVEELSNCATASDDGANGADPTPGNNEGCDTTPVDAAPDLAVTKEDSGATAMPGDTVTYSIGVQNVGNQGATGVELTETVPANTTFDAGASSGSWVCVPDASAGSTCTLAIGPTIPAGAGGGPYEFAVVIDDPLAAGVEQIENCVSVADDGTNGDDPNGANDTACDQTPIDAAPDLAVTKDDGGGTAVPGDTVSYTIDVDNVGDQDATGVVLTETVPAGSTSATPNAGWTVQGTATPCEDQAAGTICEQALGALAAGGSSSASFAVVVDDPLAAGLDQIENCASAADDGSNGADPTPGNDVACDQTPITAVPDLGITKTYDGPTPFPGETFTFDLEVANVGDQGAKGVVITETVPTATTSGTNPGWVIQGTMTACDGQAAGTVCERDLGALAGGGATTMASFQVVLDDPLPPMTPEVTNTACVEDDGTNGADPTPSNDCSEETVTLDVVPPAVTNVDTTTDTGDGTLTDCETATVGVSRLHVDFDEEMAPEVTDPASYRLVSPVLGSGFDTVDCVGGTGGDTVVPIAGITYDDGTDTATLDVGPLPSAQYRLVVCADLSDAAGNPLDGDDDGTGGDSFLRDFRVDTANLFANGHFDCDLGGWTTSSTIPGAATHSTTDADGSPLSGSGEAFNPSGTGTPEAVSYAQCVPLVPSVGLDLDGLVRIDTAAFLLGLEVFCEVHDAPACGGATLLSESQVLFAGDTGGAFQSFALGLDAPAGAASALCGAEISAGSGEAFDVFFDRVSLFADGTIFTDGFESGDTSMWTNTVP